VIPTFAAEQFDRHTWANRLIGRVCVTRVYLSVRIGLVEAFRAFDRGEGVTVRILLPVAGFAAFSVSRRTVLFHRSGRDQFFRSRFEGPATDSIFETAGDGHRVWTVGSPRRATRLDWFMVPARRRLLQT